MTSSSHTIQRLDDIRHDLDMVLFKLEQPPAEDAPQLLIERKQLRRDLERLRDRLDDVLHTIL